MVGPFLYLLDMSVCHVLLGKRRLGVVWGGGREETYTLIRCFDACDSLGVAVSDTLGYPTYGVLDTAWDVAVRLVRTHGHEHVWKMFDGQSEVSSGSVFPLVSEAVVVDSAEVYGVESSSYYGLD